jgi:hypothetical protein
VHDTRRPAITASIALPPRSRTALITLVVSTFPEATQPDLLRGEEEEEDAEQADDAHDADADTHVDEEEGEGEGEEEEEEDLTLLPADEQHAE